MQKSLKIKIIYTGGTIGMQQSSNGLVPKEESIQQFLTNYSLLEEIELVMAKPLIDSSVLEFKHWNQWLKLINQDKAQYKGIIILHGTDTLAYTASMLSLIYSEASNIPIIITGSILPLFVSNSDGRDNLFQSIQLIDKISTGVFVVLGGKILCPFDCVKISTQQSEAFITPHCRVLGTYQSQCWSLIESIKSFCLSIHNIEPKSFLFREDLKILNLYLAPSAQNHITEIVQVTNWDAIIFQSFGNGNFALEPELQTIIKNYLYHGKPVINVSQVLAARVDHQYALGRQLEAIGCISGLSLTFEFCYVLTALVLSTSLDVEEKNKLICKMILKADKIISTLRGGY